MHNIKETMKRKKDNYFIILVAINVFAVYSSAFSQSPSIENGDFQAKIGDLKRSGPRGLRFFWDYIAVPGWQAYIGNNIEVWQPYRDQEVPGKKAPKAVRTGEQFVELDALRTEQGITYTIEGDHFKRQKLATFNVGEFNEIYEQYLSESKRTKIKIIEHKR